MNRPVIRVEDLGKQYRIGRRERYGSLRQSLADAVRHAFGMLTTLPHMGRVRLPGLSRAEQAHIWALRNVNLEVREGEVVGLIGRNGAGKSTLLKILSRITEPTEGRAEIRGRVGSLLEVGTGFHAELTGRENVYLNGAILGLTRTEIDRKFDEIVDFAGVEQFIDTPVKRYSSGMQMRLAFSVAAHLEPDILLVDEVLAVGDAAFQQKCLGQMRRVASAGRTVLFVSHNMAAIRSLCSRALLLDGGHIAADSETDRVIEHYLSGIEPVAAGRINRHSQPPANGVAVVSFLARATATQNGSPQTGMDAEFLIGYKAVGRSSIPTLKVRCTVTDALGTNVFTVSTNMKGCHFRDLPPIGSIVCTIEKLPLIPGQYTVSVMLKDDWGREDYLTEAANFTVVDVGATRASRFERSSLGSVVVPHRWEFIKDQILTHAG